MNACKLALLNTLILIACVPTPLSADEQSALDEGIGRLANSISKAFEREGFARTVTVSSVIGVEGEGNAFLHNKLIDALKTKGFQIKRSKYVVSGRFIKHFGPSPVISGTKKLLTGPEAVAVSIKAEIRNRMTDRIIHKIGIRIFDSQAIMHLGPTCELPPAEDERVRQIKLSHHIDRPSVAIKGNRIQTTDDSSFAIEIRVSRGSGRDSSARTPVDVDGLGFVNLNKGEEFIVRLHNSADFEAAVTLNIDGLSMYAFCEEDYGGHVLVPPRNFVDVPGWVITDDDTDAFKITSYAKSAAAEMKIPKSNVGAITAVFHAAWDPLNAPPADEVIIRAADTAAGRGRRIQQKYITVKRVTGQQRALVTVRFNRRQQETILRSIATPDRDNK